MLCWGRGHVRENHALAGAIAGPFRIHNVLTINRRFKRSFDRARLFEGKREGKEGEDIRTMWLESERKSSN